MRTTTKRAAAALVTAAALLGGGIAVAQPALAAETCDAFDSITMGKYWLNNNLWGQDSGSGQQCVRDESQNGSTIAWSTDWSWTGPDNTVKSYVSSVLGWHWGWQSDQTGLPVQVQSDASVRTGWQYQASGTGVYNVAYDLWLTTTDAPDANTTPSDEVMIWLHNTGAGPIGEQVDTVQIAGVTFDVYQGTTDWEVYSFLAQQNTADFEADLTEFLDYLVAERGLDPSRYLSSVQAGTEVFTGEGRLETSAYYADVTP